MCASRERSDSDGDEHEERRREEILVAFREEHGDHYELAAYLGTGRFGFTYRATDLRRHLQVCVKFFKSGQAPLGTERDWNITSSLHRQDVLDTFSVEHFGKLVPDGPWEAAVSRYVDGANLTEVIERLRDLPLDSGSALRETLLRDIGIGLCVTMQSLHEEGVVHGDLHPGNIIIRRPTSTKADLQFVVIDFAAGSMARSDPSGSTAGACKAALAPEMDVDQLRSIVENIIVGARWSNELFSVVAACRMAYDLRHGLDAALFALGGLDSNNAEFFTEEHWVDCLRRHLAMASGGLSCARELLDFYAVIADNLEVRDRLENARSRLTDRILNDMSYPKATLTVEVRDLASERAAFALLNRLFER